jgi:hypothetical protein
MMNADIMKMMKEKRKNHILIPIVVSVILGTTAFYINKNVFPSLFVRLFVSWGVKESQKLCERLLCETDHVTLLEACRNLSRQAKKGEIAPGQYYIRGHPSPESSHLPKPVLDLAPSYIYIDENDSGRILIEMMGGLDHEGVVAYSEDFIKTHKGFVYGDKELIPGLWYYDDGYKDNPNHQKKINDLIRKGRMKQKAISSESNPNNKSS